MSEKDSKFMEDYQSLRAGLGETKKKLVSLSFEDRKPMWSEIDNYQNDINKLIMEGAEVAFEQYAKKLFNMSLDIIGNHLLNDAINFDKLSIKEKLDFGQNFINHIAKRFKTLPNKLEFKDDMQEDGKGADYDFQTCNINIKENDVINATLQYFIGEILHEYTHYLYDKYPELSPVGEQKARAAKENYGCNPPTGIHNDADLEAYKKRPFEAPAYYVQDYFEKHKFDEQLSLRIQNIRNSADLGRL